MLREITVLSGIQKEISAPNVDSHKANARVSRRKCTHYAFSIASQGWLSSG